MFPDDDLLPEDMLIDYNRIRVGHVYKLISQEVNRKEQEMLYAFAKLEPHERHDVATRSLRQFGRNPFPPKNKSEFRKQGWRIPTKTDN